MAEIRDRDVHDIPIPRLGGVAMYLGFLAGMLVASQLGLRVRGVHRVTGCLGCHHRWHSHLPGRRRRRHLGARRADEGSRSDHRRGSHGAPRASSCSGCPFNGVTVLPYNASVVFTVLLVVVTVNAINFVDGLDGLAAGIIGIGSLAFFAFAYLLSVDSGIDRATTAALLSTVLAGICAGFLPHNFNPARIFMGDSGSMLAGLLLSASVITLTGKIDPYSVGRCSSAAGAHAAAAARSRSWLFPWSTCCSRSSGGPVPDDRRSHPTSSTCTTGCSRSGTASDRRSW